MKCISILIVEDDKDIRETLRELLANEGYQVYAAPNGRSGIELAKSIPGPCLILLDLMMPVMSGWDFLDAQKSNAVLAQLPVVVMSAIKALEPPHRSNGYLRKPVGLEPLLQTVREYCGSPQ